MCEWVWAGTEFNIQLYNALLRVKLENGEAFVPAEVLNDIEVQKQLVPNRVGYGTLILYKKLAVFLVEQLKFIQMLSIYCQ